MNFAAAVEAMKIDPTRRFRRSRWQAGVNIRIAPAAPLFGGGDKKIGSWSCFLGVAKAHFEQRWQPSSEDLEAIDWELAR